MSQAIWATIIPSSTSGNQLATLLNGFKDAVVSGFSGTSRPSQLQAGGYWVDTTNDGTGFWDYKMYDGAQDILIFTVNKNNGTASIAGSASVFEILKTSDDSVGPILKFLKERIAGNGQVLINDIIGENRYSGTQDDGNETVQAKMRVISRDNVTSTAQGSSFIWEAIVLGTSALTEMMRLQDNKLGLGIASPTETLHIKGTGLKSEKVSDDTVGTKVVLQKKRIAGLGGVLSGDFISILSFDSYSDVGVDLTGAQIEVSATETHTATAHGTRIEFKTKSNGSTVLTSRMIIDSGGVTIPTLNVTTLNAGTVTEIVDPNIVLNKGGNQATANSFVAGFTIEMSDATHAQLGYDSTLASKFKMGLVGALKEIADVSSIQVFTNKTLTSPVLNSPSVVTPSRLDVKQDTEANLTTYALTATNGQWCFATDTKVMYQVIDTALVPAGSGGGGGSLVWLRTGDTSPVAEYVDGFSFDSFDNQSTQEIFTVIAVPSTYRAGKPIKLKGGNFFCNTATGKVFFKTESTLIEDTSVLGTYTNQRISTNAVVTVNATPNTNNAIGDLDLTSSTGTVNGVAVAPGDKLRVRLYRDNASEAGGAGPASADARLLTTAMEITFS